MNEGSINEIISYIQQYPDVSTEKLVANLLQSGYKMDDIKEVLRRQGISPIVIPGYVEPDPPPPKPFFTKMPVIIGGVVIGVLLIGVSAWVIVSPKKEVKKEELSGTVQQAVIAEPTKIPTDMAESVLPQQLSEKEISTLIEAFNSDDYKIVVENTAAPKKYSFYSKKGILIRYEFDEPVPGVYILKDGKTHLLSPNKKIYEEIDNSMETILNFLFYPKYILLEMEKHAFTLQKGADEEWNGVWRPTKKIGSGPEEYFVSIDIDSSKNLIKSFTIKSKEKPGISDVMKFTYEKISNIDDFNTIPSDYINVKDIPTPTSK